MKKSKIKFTSYSSCYEKRENELDIKLDINPMAEFSGEIRNLKISNLSNKDKQLDIFIYMVNI